MKIAILGAGGARGPLLLRGLIGQHSALPATNVALFDPAADKLSLLAPVYDTLLEQGGAPFRLRVAPTLDEAVEGAAFVVVSIRAGGMAARAADERMLLDRGLLGQETVGAAGFAKALRTIPPMLRIARAVEARAPRAWIINFSNPVGIVTEALRKMNYRRVIGICDTPGELYEGIAQALARPLPSLQFGYLGLNHLGWVKSVMHDGDHLLPHLLRDPDKIRAVYRHPLFETERIQALGVLPSEYLYYYYRTEAAVSSLRQAPQARAEAIEALNRTLWEDLGRGGGLPAYERYLLQRNSTYMTAEISGAAPVLRPQLYATAAGYDRIALAVMSAIHSDAGGIIPLDVDNRGAIGDLEDDDVVEVPCFVGRNGALPLATGRPPSSVAGLLHAVKHYERLTVRAALMSSAKDAQQALAANPLIGDRDLAAELVAAFRTMHPEWLAYLH
jgi:6-phospho-beta-glucosidase